jgi:hypothetical protein
MLLLPLTKGFTVIVAPASGGLLIATAKVVSSSSPEESNDE